MMDEICKTITVTVDWSLINMSFLRKKSKAEIMKRNCSDSQEKVSHGLISTRASEVRRYFPHNKKTKTAKVRLQHAPKLQTPLA